jgi:hypothetical protein
MLEHISNGRFLDELKSYRGLIPISIDIHTKKITWLDLEKFHFYEGFFHKSLRVFSSLTKTTTTFTTDFDILKNNAILSDNLYPSGFIFHAGRCGSTLLAKVLARSNENLVISEAEPLNQIWQMLEKEGGPLPQVNEVNKIIYRNLLLSIARRRNSAHKHLFIKFTSFNIRFFSFIHSVFPDVPAIFLTRDISEIMSSMRKKPPGWLKEDDLGFSKMVFGVDSLNDVEKVVDNFFQMASSQPSSVLKHISYKMLKAENLPYILNCLNYEADERQLSLMKSHFLFDSKEEFNKKRFEG